MEQVFFVYDHSVLKKEEDDPMEAVIYFYPQSFSSKHQVGLCGSLMSMYHLLNDWFETTPQIFKLSNAKFVVKRLNNISLCLGAPLTTADVALDRQMETLYSLFVFYHHSMQKIIQDNMDGEDELNKKSFRDTMQVTWDCLLPFSRHYNDPVTYMFNCVPYMQLPKTGSCFLEANHILENCSRHDIVNAGCLVYKYNVLCSQLEAALTWKLLIVRPKQRHLPCNCKETDFDVPEEVRLIEIYMKARELKHLGPLRQKKTRTVPIKCKKAKKLYEYQVSLTEQWPPKEINKTEQYEIVDKTEDMIDRTEDVASDLDNIVISLDDECNIPESSLKDTVLLASDPRQIYAEDSSQETKVHINSGNKHNEIISEIGAKSDKIMDEKLLESRTEHTEVFSNIDTTSALTHTGDFSVSTAAGSDSMVAVTGYISDDSSMNTCNSEVVMKGSNESLHSLSDIPESESDSSDEFQDTDSQLSEASTDSSNILEDCVLYIQSQGDLVLLLLLQPQAQVNRHNIMNLSSKVHPQLEYLNMKLRECMVNSGPATENESAPYLYLQFDQVQKKLSGNVLQPVSIQENDFCYTSGRIHNEFAISDDLTDLNMRCSASEVIGHQIGGLETYMQVKTVNSRASDGFSRLETDIQATVI